MVAAENDALPKGKVGGIGDVIRDIPKYLALSNQQVSVITPGYLYQSTFHYAEHLFDFDVTFAGQKEKVQLFKLHLDGTSGVSQFVLEHELFANAGIGNIYCDDGADRPFASDATKFALFSTALCELLKQHWHSYYDVIHLHDWHSAFIALHRALNPEFKILQKMRCVYTVHNLALQGTRPFADDPSSFQAWFPNLNVEQSLIVDPQYSNCINPARAGINLSDAVHVVSPTYATEVVRPSNEALGFIGGEGLECDLQRIAGEKKLFGILNGCQYDIKLPKKQSMPKFISQMKDVLMQWMAKHAQVTSAHLIAFERLTRWQTEKNSTGPLVTSVGRLTLQKVALLMEHDQQQLALASVLDIIKDSKGRLIILGSGDPVLEQQMTALMAEYDHFVFLNGYNDALSQAIYVQGDLFLMPSSFEPCGISQMLAMRAGQPCLVHEIGGLKDTVQHGKTGFCFSGVNKTEQISSLKIELTHALHLYSHDKKAWQQISDNAQKLRFTWQNSIQQYISSLY